MERLLGAVLIPFLFAGTAFAQEAVKSAKSTEQAAVIKAQAEKSSRAFMSGDYGRVLDSTFPRVLEMAGGRTKLLAEIETQMKQLRDLGFKIVSHTVGEPQPSVPVAGMLVAVVPTTLKMETLISFITQGSFWLAILTDNGNIWTFIDGASLNEESLKTILPEAVGKIKLPVSGQPVIETKPAN